MGEIARNRGVRFRHYSRPPHLIWDAEGRDEVPPADSPDPRRWRDAVPTWFIMKPAPRIVKGFPTRAAVRTFGGSAARSRFRICFNINPKRKRGGVPRLRFGLVQNGSETAF